ncbi:connectin-like [Ostrinia furnacalis]|uniref:connectin-like n=1 Tax=Ostrinia furnacalis TaxID=93504 RepID=UPI00103D67EC|nr:connectin-like [Ostrinia furnacalis]
MAFWKILTVMCMAAVFVESKWHKQKREANSTICDPVSNNTNKIQCFCGRLNRQPLQIANADCYQTAKYVSRDDSSWDGFKILHNTSKLTLTNTRGVAISYIPTNALKYTKALIRLDVKYCNIDKIEAFAFANLSLVKEITLRDNQIKVVERNAFSHHPSLKSISLDQNNIAEINRDVFVDLPALEKLYLTGNKITTIHDKAFIHLENLRELELDKNSIFSLNSETFSGLKKLEKLELSSNSIEVIGDNTFLPLANLRFLNLGENKIQMLDEKAFNGLMKLQFLSLPGNKISAIENEKVFEPLISLTSMSLKDNPIRVIKPEAISGILPNFYNKGTQFILEGNQLPCDCHLDVFRPLINNTQNERLKLEIQNFQCHPSEEIKQKWDKFQEIEKTSGSVFEDEEPQDSGAYEYYDETELNGTIFYFDMRHLLNCSGEEVPLEPANITTTNKSVQKSKTTTQSSTKATKATSSPVTVKLTSPKASHKSTVDNKGTLDLSTAESTTTESTSVTNEKTLDFVSQTSAHDPISIGTTEREKKEHSYTTSRLATVSAKPVDKERFDDHDMASDEAKPDRLKAHRSIQEEVKDSPKNINNAHRNLNCVHLLLSLSIIYFVVL